MSRKELPVFGPKIAGRPGAEYFELASKTILNRCSNRKMPFVWTVNPYRGCEFGCTYCYARNTHEFLGLEGLQQFENKILVKLRAVEALQAQLKPGKFQSQRIAIGTATDPYQPAEARYHLTRKLLQVFSRFRGLDISITTKSSLVSRDIDLLALLSQRSSLNIRITITTLKSDLARIVEPRAPDPLARLRTVSRLRDAGLSAGVNAMPILPEITDAPGELDSLFAEAKSARALFVATNVLFLTSTAARASYLHFLSRNFPHLVKKFKTYSSCSADYQSRIETLCEHLRRKYQLARTQEIGPTEPEQRQLFDVPIK